MFFQKEKQFYKRLTLNHNPTKETLNKIFKKYEPTSVRDWLMTTLFHSTALNGIDHNSFDGPGTYEIRLTFKIPLMFWQSYSVRIVKI